MATAARADMPTGRAHEFGDVDRARDPSRLVRKLDLIRQDRAWRHINDQMFAWLDLKSGETALDIGCGTGEDVLRTAGLVGPDGLSLGVDASRVLLQEARARAKRHGASARSLTSFVCASADRLPFPDALFDGCRAARVLMHVADPVRCVTEMARVLRPHGRLVLTEPDHTSLRFEGVVSPFTARMVEGRAAHFRHGDIGRRLAVILDRCGFANIRFALAPVGGNSVVYGDGGDIVAKCTRDALAAGLVTERDAAQWREHVSEAIAARRFSFAFQMFTVFGSRRASSSS